MTTNASHALVSSFCGNCNECYAKGMYGIKFETNTVEARQTCTYYVEDTLHKRKISQNSSDLKKIFCEKVNFFSDWSTDSVFNLYSNSVHEMLYASLLRLFKYTNIFRTRGNILRIYFNRKPNYSRQTCFHNSREYIKRLLFTPSG